MPLQNRVTPTGDIVRDPARGTVMGNRGGALHGTDGTLGARRWVSRRWIVCRLEFNGRRRSVMAPGRYTELFFLDEATALAAGHRPCFECRRGPATSFLAAWAAGARVSAPPSADLLDRNLHAERLDAAGRQRSHLASLDTLPDGAMILASRDGKPHLVHGRHLLRWSHDGYRDPSPRPTGVEVTVLTPPSTVIALDSGYCPGLHGSATVSR